MSEVMTPTASSPMLLSTFSSVRVPMPMRGILPLSPKALHALMNCGARPPVGRGVAAADALPERGEVGRVVLHIGRGPVALPALPPETPEHFREPAVRLPAEGVVHADGGDAPQVELLVGVVAERMSGLAARE